ncbi:uncharacterized protein A4U43_C02F4990 [Asparagus officinalis]|uniref:Uncharacterized protein n=1 Tax=Asparagus officinalis TaxID=4686 RepID=A0A5P1FIP9_ASPOF|nr:uncharacterized protein LOC109829390 [Asparagus officinalis]ONK77287.1 uncharacterized protein A4U43_C02F4990 [Asparagus officinalis]
MLHIPPSDMLLETKVAVQLEHFQCGVARRTAYIILYRYGRYRKKRSSIAAGDLFEVSDSETGRLIDDRPHQDAAIDIDLSQFFGQCRDFGSCRGWTMAILTGLVMLEGPNLSRRRE